MYKFYIFLSIIYFTQATGTTGGFAGQAIQFFFKEGLMLSASTVAYIGFIITIPWFIKPLWGLLSDFVPIFGYRRKSYIVICNILSTVWWILLALFTFAGCLNLYTMIPIMILIAINFAITDVTTDGLMVQTGKETGDTGSFQSAQWSAIRIAIMATTVIGGVVALWAMPDGTNIIHYNRLGYIFLLSSLFPLSNVIAAIFLTHEDKIKSSVKSTTKGIVQALKSKSLWIIALGLFAVQFSPGWGTPMFYYIRDFCGPDGGQLGKMTFAYISTYESGAGLIGCLIYWKYCKQMNLNKFLYIGLIFASITSLGYLFIKDVKSIIIIGTMFGPISAMIHLLFLDLAARNCPDKAEAFVFASLMGLFNLATVSSSAVGGWLFDKFNTGGAWYEFGWSLTEWLTNIGVSVNMIGLRPLIIISSFFTLCTILIVPFLKLNEKGIRID